MQHGPEDTDKKAHADLSDRGSAADRWADIGRKTLIVLVITLTVWAGCSLMRWVAESGTEWLFHTADGYAVDRVLWGAVFILGVMLLGGVVRGLLLLNPAWRDSEGDGIDNALTSFHSTYQSDQNNPATRYARPTLANALRKVVMTSLTIGTGGSGGLEGPGVYLGEACAAGWSKLFKRPSADELRLYQLAGVAAAIGALLNAPFTAALFAAELVYAGRIIYRKLSYCLIAAVFAYELNVHVAGLEKLFTAPGHSLVFVWQEYLLVTLIAVGFSAPAAIALGPVFKSAQKFFSGFPIILRAASGAFAAGAVAVTVGLLFGIHPKHVLGVGEHTINDVLNGTGDVVLQIWWILLLAVVAKTLATAATIKSGGSAGMLIPSMYMGGLVGAAGFYLLNEIGLYAGPSVAVFVATGMAAALTSIAGVPLASIAFVAEVYGAEYSPAAALSCAICFTASRRFSLYTRPELTNGEGI